MWLPTNQNRECVGRNSLTALPGLLVDRVQVRSERRRALDTRGVELAGRDSAVWCRIHRITGLLYLTGVTVNPFDLVLQAVNPLDRQASRLGINLVARLCGILTRVVVEHVKDNVVRVDNVAVLQQVVLASAVDNATSPLALTVEHVLVTRQEGVVVERRELTKPLSLLRREEQPVPVHVLRNVLDATTSNGPLPATDVCSRRNLAKQVISIVLRTVREGHLSTVITRQVGVDERAVVVATVDVVGCPGISTKGALELQRVVALAVDSGFRGLGNPLVLALFRHLALDPVLQRSLVAVSPTTPADLVEAKILSSLRLDLVNCIVRQVGTVNLHARCRHIGTVQLVHQARSERTLSVVQVPEQVALDLARTIANYWVLIGPVTVHHVMAGLLTKCETNVGHAVRANEPAHATRGVVRSGVRTHVAEVVAIQLREVIRIRVVHPHADLLVLRAIRVRIKLHNLALSVVKGLHLDAVVTIRTSGGGVHRGGDTTLFSPLSVDTHTLHWDRLPRIPRTWIHGDVTITLVDNVALDGLSGVLLTL